MEQKTLKYASLGSISHGTHRDEDLLENFAITLQGCILKNNLTKTVSERQKYEDLINEVLDCWLEDNTLNPKKQDDISELINEKLPDALQFFAPPYCYFGVHPGDGSDFGYWPNMEEIEELPRVEDSDQAKELGEDCKSVNDHGNVTVYSGDGSIILEIV